MKSPHPYAERRRDRGTCTSTENVDHFERASARQSVRVSTRRRRACAGVALLAVAVSFAFGVGCVPSELGTTCRFRGETETACGKCIAAACQAEINTCCGDESCQGSTLAALDTCANDGSCTNLNASSSPTSAKELATCVSTSCSEACATTSDTTSLDDATRRRLSCTSDYDTRRCVCEVDTTDQSSQTSCTKSTFGPSICCAEQAWPATGTFCACFSPFCVSGPDDRCECVIGVVFSSDWTSTSTCYASTYPEGHCCKGPKDCECSPYITCGDDETEVEECTPSDVSPGKCNATDKTVEKCL